MVVMGRKWSDGGNGDKGEELVEEGLLILLDVLFDLDGIFI